MSLRKPANLLLLALALPALLLAVGCEEKKSPEELIKARLDAAVAALENKDVKGAADLLDDDYSDDKGRDKKRLKQIAFFVLRSGPVTLNRTDETIEVDPGGNKATVTATVWAVQGKGEKKVVADLIPRGRALEVTLQMALIDDEWVVTSLSGDPYGKGYGG